MMDDDGNINEFVYDYILPMACVVFVIIGLYVGVWDE